MNSIKISDTCKMLLICIVSLGVVASAVGVFFTHDTMKWLLGIVSGTFISVIRVIMLDRTLKKAVNMDKDAATLYTRAQYTLRLFLTIAAVIAIAITKKVNIYGLVIGLLIPQPSTYLTNALMARHRKKEEITGKEECE